MREVSMPTINLNGRLQYLIQYPLSVVWEQTTSSVFPQLYLNEIVDFDATRQQLITKNVTAGITVWEVFTVEWGMAYRKNRCR
jgi:uncharacterized protein YfaS (alpha-2-macroglobulin family)